MSIVRVKPDVACVVHDAATDSMVPLAPGTPYDEHDPIVRQFPWAFCADDELDAKVGRRTAVSLDVEQATAAPGEKRGVRR